MSFISSNISYFSSSRPLTLIYFHKYCIFVVSYLLVECLCVYVCVFIFWLNVFTFIHFHFIFSASHVESFVVVAVASFILVLNITKLLHIHLIYVIPKNKSLSVKRWTKFCI